MRIAFVTESFLPVINGVTNSVVKALDHLQRMGHQTLVIAPGPGEGHWRSDAPGMLGPMVASAARNRLALEAMRGPARRSVEERSWPSLIARLVDYYQYVAGDHRLARESA